MSEKITIEAELNLPELIAHAVKWIFDRAKPEEGSSATGDRGAASATGDRGAAFAGHSTATAHASGINGRVSGVKGSSLHLDRRDPETSIIIHTWAGIVGRNDIKPMTWYELDEDGRPVEVKNK